jgi:enoyl-CoA hydratase/carnithine racemase
MSIITSLTNSDGSMNHETKMSAPTTMRLASALLMGQEVEVVNGRFSPEAVAVCLHAVDRGLNATIDEGLAIEAEAFAKMVPTAATREGLDAFITAHS